MDALLKELPILGGLSLFLTLSVLSLMREIGTEVPAPWYLKALAWVPGVNVCMLAAFYAEG